MGYIMVLARIAFMTGAILAMLAMHDTLLGRSSEAFTSGYLGSLVLVCTLGYYVLAKIGQATVGAPGRAGRVRRAGVYMDMQDNKTAIVTGVPKLTIENVWILVYGLGAVIFVMAYTLLGIEPVSLTCMGVAMGVLCIDELAHPRREMVAMHVAVRIGATLSGLISLCLVFVDSFGDLVHRFLSSDNWPAAIGGVALPFLSQFIMLCVRDYRKYTVGGVIEMCEFGLPFAVILSCCLLWTAESERRHAGQDATYDLLFNETFQWYQNLTRDRAHDPVASWAVYLCIVPLLLMPSLVLYVACVLDGCAVDPLLAVSMAVSVQYAISAGPSALNIYSIMCSSAGLILRVGSEFRPNGSDAFNAASKESIQIPNQALRRAEVQDLQAVQVPSETAPLNPDHAEV